MVIASAPREEWRELAECQEAPSELFTTRQHEALAIRDWCGMCVVRPECLGRALDRPQQYGVLGGTTARQRLRMLDAIDGPDVVRDAVKRGSWSWS